jgi:hypothetical protein
MRRVSVLARGVGLVLLVIGVSSGLPRGLGAQDSAPPPVKLRVFLDCNDCDFDFMRTEITFVDYVRDRQDAQVHILVTTQPTGGGGTEYTLHFIGQRELASTADTLKYASPPSTSPDELRHGLARTIRLGLLRYYVHLGQVRGFDVTYAAPTDTGRTQGASKDRWNLWVFRMSASGFGNGEKEDNFVSLNGSVSASRTSEIWKSTFAVNGNYGQSRFILADGSRFNTYSHSYSLSDLLVKSLGRHWSAGQRASWTSSTFLNQRSAIRFAPAIEYDIFPCSQSTRRQLTLQYSPGINFYRYQDTTIFNKISEVRGDQTLTASIDLRQPWGSASRSGVPRRFHRTPLAFLQQLGPTAVQRIFVLSVRTGVTAPRPALPAPRQSQRSGPTTPPRQLATSYTYFVNLGFSYSFGSIFNNIVNPRFGGSSGGITIIN